MMPKSRMQYAEVVRQIMRRPVRGGSRIVGIDGPSGSGKSTVARRLLAHLPGDGAAASLVEIDDFTSWVDFDGWWPRFVDDAMTPLIDGRDAHFRVRDWVGDEFGTSLEGWKTIPWAPLILVEGVTCTRRAAADWLTYAIWVEAPADLRLARGLDRDGADHRDFWVRWMSRERQFFAADSTSGRADLRVNGAPSEPHDPEREILLLTP